MPKFTPSDLRIIEYLDDALLLHLELLDEERIMLRKLQIRASTDVLLFKIAHGDVTADDLIGILNTKDPE